MSPPPPPRSPASGSSAAAGSGSGAAGASAAGWKKKERECMARCAELARELQVWKDKPIFSKARAALTKRGVNLHAAEDFLCVLREIANPDLDINEQGRGPKVNRDCRESVPEAPQLHFHKREPPINAQTRDSQINLELAVIKTEMGCSPKDVQSQPQGRSPPTSFAQTLRRSRSVPTLSD